MTTHTDSNDALTVFLQEEIGRQKKRNKMTWFVGLVLVAVLSLYLGSIGRFVKNDILEPTRLAQWVAYQMQENMPSIMADTEKALIARAPEVADQAVAGLFEVPPMITYEASKQIDLVVDSMLPALQFEITSTLEAYVAEQASQSALVYDGHQDQESVNAFIGQLASDVAGDLDREFVTDSGEGTEYLVRQTLRGLHEINFTIAELSSKSPEEMSRTEQLHYRLIVSCLRGVDDLVVKARNENGGHIFYADAGLSE